MVEVVLIALQGGMSKGGEGGRLQSCGPHFIPEFVVIPPSPSLTFYPSAQEKLASEFSASIMDFQLSLTNTVKPVRSRKNKFDIEIQFSNLASEYVKVSNNYSVIPFFSLRSPFLCSNFFY